MNPDTHDLIEDALSKFDPADVQAWVNVRRGADELERNPDAFAEAFAKAEGRGEDIDQWSKAQVREAEAIMGAIVHFTAYATQNVRSPGDITPDLRRMLDSAVQELMRYGPEYALRYVFPWLSSMELRMAMMALMGRCKEAENRLQGLQPPV